ncbi:DUF982 domain-containing protein [Rhizobium sp. P32RR-XVIII]|nr:DUF982 domain-containing protein [Rhizobium sp. P32RR-XVIII]
MIPVHVKIGDGSRKKICGPDEALECLNHRWPGATDALYETAKRKCWLR